VSERDKPGEEWQRLAARLREHAAGPAGDSITYHALMLLCGAIEAEGGPLAAPSDATLLRLGQHRASGLRRLYDDRFGAPLPDAAGFQTYRIPSLLSVVEDVEAGGRGS